VALMLTARLYFCAGSPALHEAPRAVPAEARVDSSALL
jgi:hypothetical protein